MPVVDSFTNSRINMLPDKLSGKKPVVPDNYFSYRTMSVTGRLFSGLVWHKIRLLHITQITEKIKHESCNYNLSLRKSRSYGNCHIVTGILDIFKPITALKSP